MMNLSLLVAAAAGLYLLFSLWKLLSNYRHGRGSGFDTVVCPVNPNNLIWMVLSPMLVENMEQYLPTALFRRLRLAVYGWEFRDKCAGEKRPGPGFMLVNPGRNEIWVEDAEVGAEVLSRFRDFVQTKEVTELVNLFGPNLLGSNGDEWQRQRRLIGPTINERVNKVVWGESGRQAREMTDHYLASGAVEGTLEGLRSIAFHVLGTVGYGIAQSWQEEVIHPKPGHRLSYIDAIHALASNIVVSALVPGWLLRLPGMPAMGQTIGHAVREYPSYTNELLDRERQALHDAEPRSSLLSALVRASDEERVADAKRSLTESEIQGNLFVLTLAGFDTTANTMGYAMVLLAAYPEVQNWIVEEIDRVAAEANDESYEKLFPKLVRCQALMYETLRHFSPLAHAMRCTVDPQSVTVDGRTFYFPGNSKVIVNFQALHMQESTWGSDAAAFRPSRWISAPLSASEPATLKKMPRGTFLPWSIGPRVCPGAKMAQVEFTAVMYEIFQRCKVQPTVKAGESKDQARERLHAEMKDSAPRISLQMNHPEEVQLQWIRR